MYNYSSSKFLPGRDPDSGRVRIIPVTANTSHLPPFWWSITHIVVLHGLRIIDVARWISKKDKREKNITMLMTYDNYSYITSRTWRGANKHTIPKRYIFGSRWKKYTVGREGARKLRMSVERRGVGKCITKWVRGSGKREEGCERVEAEAGGWHWDSRKGNAVRGEWDKLKDCWRRENVSSDFVEGGQ
jgi:hypothetical protein